MNRAPLVHDLKCDIKHFLRVMRNEKPYEVRKDDRDYAEGDFLLLRPTMRGEPLAGFEGACILALITHKMCHEDFEGLSEGYCSMGIKILYSVGPE